MVDEQQAEKVELTPEKALAVATTPAEASSEEATTDGASSETAEEPSPAEEASPAETAPITEEQDLVKETPEKRAPESSFSVDDFLKQLDIAKREVQELKQKVAAANKKKEAAFRKKQEMSKEVGEKIGELLGNKKERNSLTTGVKELKKERDRLNKLIREKVQEIKQLNEKHKDIVGARFDRKSGPEFLQRQIEEMEFKLETQPMGFEAEQKLTKKLKDIKKQYNQVKGTAGALTDLRERSKEIDKLKREANALHRQVQEQAKASQNRHEHLVGESKEVDDLKKREEECYQAFLVEKKKYMDINQLLKEKIAELQRIKEELNKRDVKVKEDQKKEDLKTLKERAKDAEEKVKKKQKLTTEDLLAMQGFKK